MSPLSKQTESTTSGSSDLVVDPPRLAKALFSFRGEEAYGELSFDAGSRLEIWVEDVSGGWSLGCVLQGSDRSEHGLVPKGWYSVRLRLLEEFYRLVTGTDVALPPKYEPEPEPDELVQSPVSTNRSDESSSESMVEVALATTSRDSLWAHAPGPSSSKHDGSSSSARPEPKFTRTTASTRIAGPHSPTKHRLLRRKAVVEDVILSSAVPFTYGGLDQHDQSTASATDEWVVPAAVQDQHSPPQSSVVLLEHPPPVPQRPPPRRTFSLFSALASSPSLNLRGKGPLSGSHGWVTSKAASWMASANEKEANAHADDKEEDKHYVDASYYLTLGIFDLADPRSIIHDHFRRDQAGARRYPRLSFTSMLQSCAVRRRVAAASSPRSPSRLLSPLWILVYRTSQALNDGSR
jgi:hypothetical protein